MKLHSLALAFGLLAAAPGFALAQPKPLVADAGSAQGFDKLTLTSSYRNPDPGYDTSYSIARQNLSDYTFTLSSDGSYTLKSPAGTTSGKFTDPGFMAHVNDLVTESKLATGTPPAYRSSIEGHGAAMQPFTLTGDFGGKTAAIAGVAESPYMTYAPKSATPLVDFALKLSFAVRWLQAGAPIESAPNADDPALRAFILDQLKDPKIGDDRLVSILSYLGDVSKVHDERYQLLTAVRAILAKDPGPGSYDAIRTAIDKAAKADLFMSQPYEDDNDRLDYRIQKIDPAYATLDATTKATVRNQARSVLTFQGSGKASDVKDLVEQAASRASARAPRGLGMSALLRDRVTGAVDDDARGGDR
jgi:hypothetical protein